MEIDEKIVKIQEGMTEEELLKLCDPKNAFTGKFPWVYWTSELYSHGKYIREYAFYPQYLPLIMYSDHSGMSGSDIPSKHELETDAPVFFTFSKSKALKYRQMTGKQSYVMLLPAFFYRKKYRINQAKDAAGTIAFPAHSTCAIDNVGDINKYAQQLKSLPKKYQPVVVCLHMHDINKGQYKIFMKHGLPVVTAGNTSDFRFLERLYAILRNYSFATSNIIGSFTALSIEMGIPFFVYGELQKFINHSDHNIPLGEYDVNTLFPFYKELYDKLRFEDFNGEIDKTIKAAIERESGVYDTISRGKMCLILWLSFFSWILKMQFVKYIASALIKKAKMKK